MGPARVATVTIAPSPLALQVGATQQLTAVTLDARGAVLTGRSVSWSSSSPTVAQVSASGMVTAITPGTFTDNITVRAGSSAYYEISGSNRPATAIRFRIDSGAQLPASMQVWIVRVQ